MSFVSGVYLLVMAWYFLVFVVERLRDERSVLATPVALLGVPLGATTLVSGALGYADGGWLLAGVVGIAPGIAFGIVGTILRILDLNDPDTSVWAFVIPLSVVGVLFALAGFVVGNAV